MIPVIKAGIDVGAVAYIVGIVVGAAPAIGSVLIVVYYALLVWQSETVKSWRARWTARHAPPQSPSATGQEPAKPA